MVRLFASHVDPDPQHPIRRASGIELAMEAPAEKTLGRLMDGGIYPIRMQLEEAIDVVGPRQRCLPRVAHMHHHAVDISAAYVEIDRAGIEMLLAHDVASTETLECTRYQEVGGKEAVRERRERVLDAEARRDGSGQIKAAGFRHRVDEQRRPGASGRGPSRDRPHEQPADRTVHAYLGTQGQDEMTKALAPSGRIRRFPH